MPPRGRVAHGGMPLLSAAPAARFDGRARAARSNAWRPARFPLRACGCAPCRCRRSARQRRSLRRASPAGFERAPPVYADYGRRRPQALLLGGIIGGQPLQLPLGYADAGACGIIAAEGFVPAGAQVAALASLRVFKRGGDVLRREDAVAVLRPFPGSAGTVQALLGHGADETHHDHRHAENQWVGATRSRVIVAGSANVGAGRSTARCEGFLRVRNPLGTSSHAIAGLSGPPDRFGYQAAASPGPSGSPGCSAQRVRFRPLALASYNAASARR